MDRRFLKLSSLARDFFSAFPERDEMPLDLLPEEEQRAFADIVQPIAEAVAAAADGLPPPPTRSGNDGDADSDPRLRNLTVLAMRLADGVGASPHELAAARRAADYAQVTAALAVISAAEHFVRHRHVAAALLDPKAGEGRDAGGVAAAAAAAATTATALGRWRQEHVRRRLVAAGFAHATAPLVVDLLSELRKGGGETPSPPGPGKGAQGGGGEPSPSPSPAQAQAQAPSPPPPPPPPRLLRPFADEALAAWRRGMPPEGRASTPPQLRRRLDASFGGCLHGVLSPPPGGWRGLERARPSGGAAAAAAAAGEEEEEEQGGAVVLVGDAAAWLAAGEGALTGLRHSWEEVGAAPPPCPPPTLSVAYVAFASPAAAARRAADDLLAAVAKWRAMHQAPWPGEAEGGDWAEEEAAAAAAAEEEIAAAAGGGVDGRGFSDSSEPVVSLSPGGMVTLRLPKAHQGWLISVRMLPVGGDGDPPPSSSSSPSSPAALLALERLLLQGVLGGPSSPPSAAAAVVGCSPCPAAAFDGEAVWGLPRSVDAIREAGLVLEARRWGAEEGGDRWAERRAAELRRAAGLGWQARVPYPAEDDDEEGAREVRELEAACAAAAVAAAAGRPAGGGGGGGGGAEGAAATARAWPYRGFLCGPRGSTALPAGLLDALIESWEAAARRPYPRGPYQLVAFGE